MARLALTWFVISSGLGASGGCANLLGLSTGQAEPSVCSADQDCAPGNVCLDLSCRPTCASQRDCNLNEACADLLCVPVAPLCRPGARRCDALTPEVCDDSHRWNAATAACTSNCAAGFCQDAASCDASPLCGDGSSCCQSLPVQGGVFPLQFTLSDGAVRAVQRTVSSFALDRFEVTYSRFREFLAAYDSLDLPREGDGAHPKIARSGWQEAWNRDPALSKDRLELEHDMSLCGDWRDSAAQDLPVRCVNWFIAMRFCIWDGGRLPTEAEWTYAASAGSEAREYPWENEGESESIDEGRAWYTLGLPQRSGPIAVGSRPTGHGRFGQDDLAGNVVEWVADWYHQQVSDTPCIEANNSTARRGTTQDCMELNPTDMRSMKGGSYRSFAADLTTFARAGGYPARNGEDFGFRCVRDPK